MGIRAFVGKLSMDISTRPTYIESSVSDALEAARTFIRACRDLSQALPPARRTLVQPVLTPRFVPTCSDALLHGLSALAAEEGVRVQSHMSEAHDQVAWVRTERGKSDVDVFREVSSTRSNSRYRSLQSLFCRPIYCPVLSKPTVHSSTHTLSLTSPHAGLPSRTALSRMHTSPLDLFLSTRP
jgi:hypothetical protein